MIRSWLKSCKSHHRSCRVGLSGTRHGLVPAAEPATLPLRIIEVRDLAMGGPRVIEPKSGLQAEYAALSYCWGQKLEDTGTVVTRWTHVTLSTNLEDRLNQPLGPMPKTIEDAFDVCQQLEIFYLWVDSICIVQDDKDEWERESQKMSAIYENAVLTIGALGAHDVREGCFLPRHQPSLYADMTLTIKDENLDLGVIRVSMPQENHDPMSSSDWNRRGWTFQERLLSRRIVYYGQNQVLWECQQGQDTEDGTGDFLGISVRLPTGVTRGTKADLMMLLRPWIDLEGFIDELLLDFGGSKVFLPLRLLRTRPAKMYLNFILKMLDRLLGSRMSAFSIWFDLVSDYSDRQLTDPTDKLLAIQGTANAYAQSRKRSDYICGLHLEHITVGLGWYAAEKPLQKPALPRGEFTGSNTSRVR